MRRLPLLAFAALAVATIAAFFVAQHLKVTTPLIAGNPRPFPAFVNPNQLGCKGANRYTNFSFYLLHRADDVAVWVVDSNGTIVRSLASGRHMRRGVRFPDGNFPWDGRKDDGRFAPDGIYYFRIALLRQGRTIELNKTPLTIKTTPPHPVVTAVSPPLVPRSGQSSVTIRYQGVQKRGGSVLIYRTDLGPRPVLVKSFGVQPGSSVRWDARIHKRPPPPGTYLIGLQTTDSACNTGRFPSTLPPSAGSTPHAGLTVRYLAVQPPVVPVAPGSATAVYVDSRQRPYTWSLQRVGARRAVAHGSGRSFALRVRAPRGGAGLYVLSVSSGVSHTAVPLVLHAPGGAGRGGRVLVVLPSLTWQGQNPVDDNGDGVPNTLDNGGPISLQRPFAHGLPVGFGEQAGLLSYLDGAHLGYDLTTDVGLTEGTEPRLGGYRGVVFAGSARWVPASLGAALRSYVQGGGHVVSVGIDSLLRAVTVTGSVARAPTPPASVDALDARVGRTVIGSRQLLLVIRDGLGIFSSTSGAFPGYSSFQPISGVAQPASKIVSAAGTSDSSAAVAGYRLGRGFVVRIGLTGFGGKLARDVDSQELVRRLWAVLGR